MWQPLKRRWQLAGRYVRYASAWKRASEAPRTHFRAYKISKFLGMCPQTPLIQSIVWVPLFVFALAPHNLASRSRQWPISFCQGLRLHSFLGQGSSNTWIRLELNVIACLYTKESYKEKGNRQNSQPCQCMYRLYNEVKVSTGHTLPRAVGPRLCIP